MAAAGWRGLGWLGRCQLPGVGGLGKGWGGLTQAAGTEGRGWPVGREAEGGPHVVCEHQGLSDNEA